MYAAAIALTVLRRPRPRVLVDPHLRARVVLPGGVRADAVRRDPGKRVFGLRVVMDNGLPVTAAASVTRNLLRVGRLPAVRLRFRRSSACCCGATASGSATSRPGRWCVHEPRRAARIALDAVAPVVPVAPLAPEDQAALIALAARAPATDRRTPRRARSARGRRLRRRRTSRARGHAARARRRAVGCWGAADDAAAVRSSCTRPSGTSSKRCSIACSGAPAPASARRRRRTCRARASRRCTAAPASSWRWRGRDRIPPTSSIASNGSPPTAHQVIYQHR